VTETEHPDTTIRLYEWRGILARVAGLVPVSAGTSWLDFGCGAGGLVQFLLEAGVPGAVGFEPGWASTWLERRSIPSCPKAARPECRALRRGDGHRGLEHAVDPLAELKRSARSCARADCSSSPRAMPRRSATASPPGAMSPRTCTYRFRTETLAARCAARGSCRPFPASAPVGPTSSASRPSRASSDTAGPRSRHSFLAGRGAPDRSAPETQRPAHRMGAMRADRAGPRDLSRRGRGARIGT